MTSRTTTRTMTMFGAVLLAGALFVAGCGSDDDESSDDVSSQDAYCQAGEELRVAIEDLVSLDIIATGTDGLRAAVDSVESSLADLRDAADEAAAEEVEALEESVEAAESSLSDLGEEISVDNATAVGSAVAAVGTSAQAVYDTLTDC